jgi:hypothetical protein
MKRAELDSSIIYASEQLGLLGSTDNQTCSPRQTWHAAVAAYRARQGPGD